MDTALQEQYLFTICILLNTCTMVLPSLKLALSKRKNGVSFAPHVGVSKLLHDPFMLLYLANGSHFT